MKIEKASITCFDLLSSFESHLFRQPIAPVFCLDIYPYIIISPVICPDIYPYIIISYAFRIRVAFDRNPTLPNLLVDPDFSTDLNERQLSWRRVVSLAIATGIPAAAFSGSLMYFDAYRRARLPANLTQV
jgi:hypothetical protein